MAPLIEAIASFVLGTADSLVSRQSTSTHCCDFCKRILKFKLKFANTWLDNRWVRFAWRFGAVWLAFRGVGDRFRLHVTPSGGWLVRA